MMKMIDIFGLMAEGKIKEGTKLKIGENVYSYIDVYGSFANQKGCINSFLEEDELITTRFLNSEVELLPPKEKKYLIMLNVRGLRSTYNYLNYYNIGIKPWVLLGDEEECTDFQTHFTKSELQSIKPVREFLEDMEGKYELIEVEDNEID